MQELAVVLFDLLDQVVGHVGVAVHNRNNRSFLCERTGDGCADSLAPPVTSTTFLRGKIHAGATTFWAEEPVVDAKLDQVPFLQIGFRIHAHAHAGGVPVEVASPGRRVMN